MIAVTIFSIGPARGDQGPGSFLLAAHLQIARASAASVVDGDGVLVVGGDSIEGPLTSVERWTSKVHAPQGAWQYIGRMAVPRSGATATALVDGRVLIAGGGGKNPRSTMAELYGDPDVKPQQIFAPAGRMVAVRAQHSATRLADGRVLVAGGFDANGNALATAEIWSPQAKSWRAVGRMHEARGGHAAALLPDGRVLIVGGDLTSSLSTKSGRKERTSAELPSAELFEPKTGRWTPIASLPDSEARAYLTATVLSDGRVLVAGGVESPAIVKSRAWLWEASSGKWTSAGVGGGRAFATATRLPDGRVIVIGGRRSCAASAKHLCTSPMETTDSTELWDPVSSQWRVGPVLSEARSEHCAEPLPDGGVLVVGGKPSGGDLFLGDSERWNP